MTDSIVRSRAALRRVTLSALIALVCSSGAADDALGEDTLPTYASVRTEVTVQRLAEKPYGKPRPAKFFQLAGAGNRELCEKVLDVFNEPGRFDGYDPRWLLDNSHQIDFRSLNAPQGEAGATDTQYNFPDLEYVSVDMDADGSAEHVYRLNSISSSREYQNLMIVDVPLQSRPELLSRYAKRCTEIEASAECGQINTMIRYALRARVPDRLAEEWAFTREGIWNWTTMDAQSQRQISPERNRAGRNVAGDSDAYWSLYRIDSAVVAVAAPNLDYAPPELAVFVPGRQRNAGLQCVLMPVAWHK